MGSTDVKQNCNIINEKLYEVIYLARKMKNEMIKTKCNNNEVKQIAELIKILSAEFKEKVVSSEKSSEFL